MTESRVPAGVPVMVAIFVFLAVLAVLAVRVRDGEDPALRARLLASSPPPRRVLVRRVLERRIVVQLPAGAGATPAASASQQVGSAAAFAVPVTRTS